MNKDEQKIKIAEVCGWKGISAQHLVGYAPWRHEPYSDRVNACPLDELECIPLDPLPDYLNDLNATYEVEKFLTDEQFDRYQIELSRIVFDHPCSITYPVGFKRRAFWNASPAQRCRAILQTLNLWTE